MRNERIREPAYHRDDAFFVASFICSQIAKKGMESDSCFKRFFPPVYIITAHLLGAVSRGQKPCDASQVRRPDCYTSLHCLLESGEDHSRAEVECSSAFMRCVKTFSPKVKVGMRMVTIEAIGLVCSLFSRKKPVVVLIELQNWLFWSFVLTLAGYRITAKSKPRLWRWLSVDWSAIASDFNFQANGRIRISHFGQIMSLCDRLIPINYYRVPVREDMHGSVMTSTGHWNDLRVSNSLLTLEDSALFIAQHGGGYGLYKSQFAQEYFETKAASIYFTWYRNIDFTGCLSIQINRFNRPHWPLPEWFKRQRVVKCTRIIVMLPRFKKNARLDPWDSVEFYQIVVQTVLRIKHLIADVDIDFRVKGHPAQVSDDPSEYHKILEGIRKFGSEKLKSTDLCIAFGATTTLHSLLNEPCGFLAYCGLESGVDYERVISAFGPHSSQLILNDVDKMLARLATLLSNGIDRENIEKTRCFVAGGCAYDDAFRGARILR